MNMRAATTWAAVTCAALAAAAGCGTRRVTDTPRTATEQLLVAAAVERAVSQLDFEFLEGRKVFLDDSLVDRVDRSFVVAEVRAAGWRAGLMFVDQRQDAQYVMELQAGAVGTDRNEYVLGIPASQVPTLAGAVGMPEVPVYKSITQTGACRIGFVAYCREDGRFFYASGPAYGFSDHKSSWLLGAGPGVKDNIAPARTSENTASVQRPPAGPEEGATEPE